jgi:glycine/D-amino acid oxidase-like deaminating enzyme
MPSPDLAIVGGGIVGCALAHAAAVAGLRVALFEAAGLADGATGAGMGHLVVLDEDPAECALARASMRCMENWPASLRQGHAQIQPAPTGTLWLAESASQHATALAKRDRLRAFDWDAEWLDAPSLRAAEPALAHDLVGALWVPRDDVIYGPGVALGLAREAQALGACIHTGTRVRSVQARGLMLDSGTNHAAGAVVVAAGVLTPLLLQDPELPIRPRKGLLAITDRYPGWLRHAVVELGYVDSALGDAPESVAFNLQPRETGQLLIGSSREYGETDSTVGARVFSRMVSRAHRFVPRLGELQLLRAWAGFRPATPDGRPLIGRLPSGVWVAAGHEGLGLTTAAGTAAMFCDLLLGRAPLVDPAPFDPMRFNRPAVASMPQASEGVR